MKSRTLPLLAALSLSTAAFAAPVAQEPVPPNRTLEAGTPQPAVWLLSDADTRIYLFGTNHVLPHDFSWRSPDLDLIISNADELVMEVMVEEAIDLFSDAENFSEFIFLEEPVPILDRIDREYRMPLRVMLKGYGLEAREFDAFQTWFITFSLIGLALGETYGTAGDSETDYDALNAGYEMTGVEYQLTEIFTAREIPIGAVETSMDQIDFFRSLSEDGQRNMLESMVELEPEESEILTVEDTLQVWVTGDVSSMDAECDDEANFPPELREIILTRRNASWTEWLIHRLEELGNTLFAVGACHLAGSGSVQTLLEASGYSVERVY